MLRGKSEAKFSVCRKIAAANTMKIMKKMKITQQKVSDNMSGPMTKSQKTLGKEFQDLFSETLKDYSVLDKVLIEREKNMSPRVKQNEIFIDPASKFLQPGTPISEISGKDLPSPTGIKGEKNILLLPYY